MPKGAKYGGRVKGTPNKTTRAVKECISTILTDYTNSDQFMEDFASLEPKDRLAIAEKLLQYSVPKMQSTSVDLQTTQKKTIEDALIELSKEE